MCVLKMKNKSLNRTLRGLGYTVEPHIFNRKKVLYKGRLIFTGTQKEIWKWLTQPIRFIHDESTSADVSEKHLRRFL